MRTQIVPYLLALGCCVVGMLVHSPKRDSEILKAFVDAIAASHMSVKAVAADLNIGYSQFLKILRGQPGHYLPNLERLSEDLPFAVWKEFLPSLSRIVVRRHLEQSTADVERIGA